MPRPARDYVRNNTHIYVSQDFILSDAATKHFNQSGMYAKGSENILISSKINF